MLILWFCDDPSSELLAGSHVKCPGHLKLWAEIFRDYLAYLLEKLSEQKQSAFLEKAVWALSNPSK